MSAEAPSFSPSILPPSSARPSSFLCTSSAVPEADLSGTVVDANNSTRFKNGDLVFGIISAAEGGLKLGRGAICQYAVVPVSPSVFVGETSSGVRAEEDLVGEETKEDERATLTLIIF